MQFKSPDALVGLVTSFAILVALLPLEWQDPLVYQRDNFDWHQLVTANLVHENARHLVSNLVGLILIGILARSLMSGLQFAVILVFGLLGAVLAEHALGQPPYLSFTVAETRGLSGALHGLFAASMLYLAVTRDRLALIILCGLLLKVSIEAFRGETLISSGSVELVAVMGHFGGTFAGLVMATALLFGSRLIKKFDEQK